MADSSEKKNLFCFGFGFAAQALAERLHSRNWTVSGTSRFTDQRACLTNVPLFSFDGTHASKEIFKSLTGFSTMLETLLPLVIKFP